MRTYLVAVLISCAAFPSAAIANQDQLEGAYIAKNPSNQFAVIKRLVLRKAKEHNYDVEMEIRGFLCEDKKRACVLQGYADVYSPCDDKLAADRIFIHFPKASHSPFLEIYPGQKSSPNNRRGYLTLLYTYFEKDTWHSYVSDELIRSSLQKKPGMR